MVRGILKTVMTVVVLIAGAATANGSRYIKYVYCKGYNDVLEIGLVDQNFVTKETLQLNPDEMSQRRFDILYSMLLSSVNNGNWCWVEWDAQNQLTALSVYTADKY